MFAKLPGITARPWLASLGVFVASLMAVLVFWTVVPASWQAEPVTDYEKFYEPVARGLIQGRGLWHSDGSPALRYPPGYPVVLAGVFALARLAGVSEQLAMDVFVLVAFGLTTVLLHGFSRLVWGPRLALITAAVWMTYPVALWLTRQPNSELPFMVVVFGGVLLCATTITSPSPSSGAPRYLAAGFLTGVAMLIRPIAIGLGVVLAGLAWMALRRRTPRVRHAAAAMILAGNLLAVLPWELWVYRQTGQIVPLSTGGIPSMRDGLTFAVRTTERAGTWVPRDVRELMLELDSRYGRLTSLGAIADRLWGQWRVRPMAVVKLYGLKLARSWYGTDSQRFETPILLVQLVYVPVMLWGGLRALRRGGRPRQAALGVSVLVGYFWAMNLVGLALLRYMVPAIGLGFLVLPVLVAGRGQPR